MAGKVKPIPDGYHAITAYLSIKGASDAIEFYKKAFGAKEVMRMAEPDGRIGHAELQIGDCKIMLADEHPEMDFRSPRALGGTPVMLHLYVDDVDTVVGRAVTSGTWPRIRKTFRWTRSASAPPRSTRASRALFAPGARPRRARGASASP